MSESALPCRRYHVSGRVQGVHFRASTRECATRLGLVGWACNLADGRVEVIARGSPSAHSQFADWLLEGPRLARVSGVSSELVEIRTPAHFEVR